MSIRKRKWDSGGKQKEAWVFNYVDQHGNRRQRTFKTQKKAKKEEAKVLTEVPSGIHVADRDSITIAEAADIWKRTWASGNLEEATMRAFRAILKYNIIPLIGHRRLNRFTIQEVIQFQDDLKETCYPSGFPTPRMQGRSRTRDAVRRSAMVLGAIFATAQLRGKATNNPVYAIPRKKRPYRKSDREKLAQRAEVGIDIPTPDEISLILDHVCGWYRLLIVVAIFCGGLISTSSGACSTFANGPMIATFLDHPKVVLDFVR